MAYSRVAVRTERARFAAGVAPALVIFAVVLMAFPYTSTALSATRPGAPHGVAFAAALPRAGVHPSAGGVSGTFFSNTTRLLNIAAKPCLTVTSFGEEDCYSELVSPSVMSLGGNNVATVYQTLSATTNATCFSGKNSAANQTVARIGVSLSSDGGATFASSAYVGDNGNATCPYFQQLEPAFTTDGLGHIVGAYIGANVSSDNLTAYSSDSDGPVYIYGYRPSDALIYINSTNGGASFSAGTVIEKGANFARPSIATFGRTIYVVYENIAAGVSQLTGSLPPVSGAPFNTSFPVQLLVTVSKDDGATWSTPVALPGQNATAGTWSTAFNPSITVDPANGTVAIVYDTNRACIYQCANPTEYVYGDDIVTTWSSNNGTTWGNLKTVASRQPEWGQAGYAQELGETSTYVWQYAPQTAIAWAASGGLYVSWSAPLFSGSLSSTFAYDNLAVFTGASSNLGASWRTAEASPPSFFGTTDSSIWFYSPALGVSGGKVYLSYLEGNGSFTISTAQCSFLTPASKGNSTASGFSSWIETSTDGVDWSPPGLLSWQPGVAGTFSDGYLGNPGSIAFNATGSPIVGQGMPTNIKVKGSSSVTIYTYFASVSIAHVPAAPAVGQLTLGVSGLPVGTAWGAAVGSNLFSVTTNSVTITNLPSGVPQEIGFEINSQGLGYETIRVPSQPGEWYNFTGAHNWVNITAYTLYGVTFYSQPVDIPNFAVQVQVRDPASGFLESIYGWTELERVFNGNVQYFSTGDCTGNVPGFPWYIPAGTSLSIGPSNVLSGTSYTAILPISGWLGTGSGSYTGPGPTVQLNVTGPINETLTMLLNGKNYSVDFGTPGLPASSTFNFTVNGTQYSMPGTANLTVDQLPVGPQLVTNITGTSTPGYEYFGEPNVGNPILVPNDPQVNLSFAKVDMAAAPGTITFHALNLTSGTIWQLEFNGTTYAASTPWMNITTRPGVYPIQGFPIDSSYEASSTYAPQGLAPYLNVTPSRTYTVNFEPVFQVRIAAGFGGSVTPTGSYWIVPGGNISSTATVNPGYEWDGWSGTGLGSYTGLNLTAVVTARAAIFETANFVPRSLNRFWLNFSEVGVPTGTVWTVDVDGVGYSSNTTFLSVPQVYSCSLSGNLGKYTLVVPYAYENATSNLTRYFPTKYPSTACGGSTPTALVFVSQFWLTLQTTTGGGVAAATGTEYVPGSAWFDSGVTVVLSESAGSGYKFLGWNGTGPGSYTGTNTTPTINMSAPLFELAAFQKIAGKTPTLYWLLVNETTPLAAGTAWSISLGGLTTYSSTAPSINITGLSPGYYTASVGIVLSPNGTIRYTPTQATSRIHLQANGSFQVGYALSYLVTISSIGPGVVDSGSGWYQAGVHLSLSATPTGDDRFVGWQGTGSGSYTGSNSTGTVVVDGPITEVGSFLAVATKATATPSMWTSSSVEVALALLGLVVGIAVGLLLFARRPRSAASPSGPEPEELYGVPKSPPEDDEPPAAEPTPEPEAPPSEPEELYGMTEPPAEDADPFNTGGAGTEPEPPEGPEGGSP